MWTITKDLIADEGAKPGTNCNAVGKVGPRGTTATSAEIAAHPEAKAFRLYDDDGELYYEGFWVDDARANDPNDGEQDFEPLYHFGQPNAGATRIDYKNAAGEWESI